MLVWGGLTTAAAQDPSRAILGAGNAVITGFSGVRPPAGPFPPSIDPMDRTYIDLDRPSARIINLDALLGPPAAQYVPAPKPFSATAAQVGQVFSIALDDATPPNIYLAATSAYGLPIVVPDRDGDGRPDRSRRGGPNANFMPGLFGPVTVNGGPGSIWKIDGRTGGVALFANVMLDGVPNSGAALGGLAFDPGSRQLFVADRNTGMIHRFMLDGADRGRFDHGTDALRVAGIAPVPFDPRNRLDLANPAFDSGNPGTWAYAPPARRVFGLSIRSGRIFYAVAADLQIWSVSIARDGGFGSDARLELNVPPGGSVAEISNIVFDDDGRMIVAERGAPTGAYDYLALAAAGENRVLRFRLKRPDDPPGPGLWYPVPEEYAIGFPPNFRNDNGGLAIGYGYGANGAINRLVCGGTLWSTGEQLRNARDPAVTQRLQPGGPIVVNGLQGNAIALVRPQNEPPFESYFIDYDDRFDDVAARGHLGDVEIWRVCAQTAVPPLVPPVPLVPPLVCPPGWFDVGGVCVTGQTCPSGTSFEDGCCVYKECPPSYISIGGRCVPPPVICKIGETYADGRCRPAACPPGLVVTPPKNGTNGPTVPSILKSGGATNGLVTNGQATGELRPLCPDGKPAVDGRCPPAGDRGKMCASYCGCPEGTNADENGKCVRTPPPELTLCPVPPFTIADGKCCTGAVGPRGDNFALTCFSKPAGATCGPGAGPVNATTCCAPVGTCPMPPGDVCPAGLQRVCRGEGPLKACSCEPEKKDDQCPAGTVRQCTGTDPKLTCKCVPQTTAECQSPDVVVDGVCCKRADYLAGLCGGRPLECAFPNVLVGGECCKESDYRAGTCGGTPPPPRAIVVPPPPSPGAELGYCPRPFRMVGTSCCNLLTAGQCYFQTGGIACQPGYNSVGEGLSAQCCRQSAFRCTRRSANASCASGEVPVEWQGADPACCRPDPAGSCTPPSTPTPNPPRTGDFNFCDIPILGALCGLPRITLGCQSSLDCPSNAACIEGSCREFPPPEQPSATGGWPKTSPPPPPTLSCTRDADCPAHHDCPGGLQGCREGVCRCRELTQPASAPTSTCSPPSTLVNGQCCTPEAVAAGTCGAPPPPPSSCPAGLFPSNDGKTCCTKEQITRETCGAPPPAAPKKAKAATKPKTIPAKPKEIVCQKGFHLEGGRCVADAKPQAIPGFDFQIGIGIGGGGRRGGSPGGGAPKPPSPPPPN